MATVDQVLRLADLMPARYRVLVLFAALTGLRWGELIALRRCDLDLEAGTVRVHRSFAEMGSTAEIIVGPPKSAAGKRTVALPRVLIPELRAHLRQVDADDEALIFTGAKGAVLRRANFRRAVRWKENTEAVRLRGFTFHDLRHTGNTLAAASGATRELMHRMGHESVRAALIYQHATSQRDREIADAMDERIRVARSMGEAPAPTAVDRMSRSEPGSDGDGVARGVGSGPLMAR